VRIHRTEAEIAEHERRQGRRLEEAIAPLGARNMNNTKWFEVFDVLRQPGRDRLRFRFKFVDSDRILEDLRPWPVNEEWTDSTYGPFRNREIEWLELLGPDVADVKARLITLGRLPVRPIDGGFRICAYGLVESDPMSEARG
jgi:hypothetical protein